MNMIAVESSTLAAIGYDDALGVLELEFRSGAVYQYIGVLAAVHQGLLNAPSKTGYFNQSIRGRFSYRSITITEAHRGTHRPCLEDAR